MLVEDDVVDVDVVEVDVVEVDVVVVGIVVLVVVVVVVVVVGGGITNPSAQPHRISMGAPMGVPCAPGVSSMMRRS